MFDVAVPEPAAALITKYGRLAAAIHSAGLHGSWNLKPLLDGNTLMKELPGLKKGPLMGQIMEAQLRWQLESGPPGLGAGLHRLPSCGSRTAAAAAAAAAAEQRLIF